MNAYALRNILTISVTLDTAVVVVVVIVVVTVRMVMIHKANNTHMSAYNKITCSHHVLSTNSTDTYHPKLIEAD